MPKGNAVGKVSKSLILLILAMVLFAVLAAVFYLLDKRFDNGVFFALFVTFLTVFYHFIMRLAVGEIITILYAKKEFRYEAKWYRQSRFEKFVYKKIDLKKHKRNAITAKPWQFDINERTYEELLHNMTQAEVVHEIIMVLSFVPILFSFRFGALAVFVITSVFACLIDMYFVMIQRFNRPRVLALKRKMDNAKKSAPLC
ncbi:hypothetical protein [Huintestinicola sp.]|uniref:glycosyl-4,4'-diaponeurosporenoate acyltransferase CrtO family protein n=1 Tax=Huintestinicola sp. TaxID=2981661 RepID=UPI003D7EA0A3